MARQVAGKGEAARKKTPAEILVDEMDSHDGQDAEDNPSVIVYLNHGDAIICKISEEVTMRPGSSRWYTYGVSTQLRPEEIEGVELDADDDVAAMYDDARSRAISAVLQGLSDLKQADAFMRRENNKMLRAQQERQ